MSERPEPPLIFCSGLAADDRVFTPQKLAFPRLIVPRWPVPLGDESLNSYCERIAADLGPLDHPILGGSSFGGIIALHLARFFKPRAIILIGSVRRPEELSLWIRRSRCLRPLVSLIPVRLLQFLMAPLSFKRVQRLAPHLSGLADQFCQADPAVFRWSLRRVLDWSSEPEIECPVYHIHGQRDFVLTPRYGKPDRLIGGGGHVISLTHHKEVNDFIRSVVTNLLPREDELTNCR